MRMYQIGLDMGIAEYAVRKAIEDLSRHDDTIDYRDIAALIGCNRDTVGKAVRRLIAADVIRRHGSNFRGYQYEVTCQTTANT